MRHLLQRLTKPAGQSTPRLIQYVTVIGRAVLQFFCYGIDHPTEKNQDADHNDQSPHQWSHYLMAKVTLCVTGSPLAVKCSVCVPESSPVALRFRTYVLSSKRKTLFRLALPAVASRFMFPSMSTRGF